MDIYGYEVEFEKAFHICNIIERITGRTIYHGDTHYNYNRVFEQMKADAKIKGRCGVLHFFACGKPHFAVVLQCRTYGKENRCLVYAVHEPFTPIQPDV